MFYPSAQHMVSALHTRFDINNPAPFDTSTTFCLCLSSLTTRGPRPARPSSKHDSQGWGAFFGLNLLIDKSHHTPAAAAVGAAEQQQQCAQNSTLRIMRSCCCCSALRFPCLACAVGALLSPACPQCAPWPDPCLACYCRLIARLTWGYSLQGGGLPRDSDQLQPRHHYDRPWHR